MKFRAFLVGALLVAIPLMGLPAWGGAQLSPAIASGTNLGLVQGDGATLAISSAGVVSIPSNSTWVGSTNITTLGTITSGTWTGTSIAVLNGGTGATTAANARTNLGAANVAGDTFTGTVNVGTSNQFQVTTTGAASASSLAISGTTALDSSRNATLGTVTTTTAAISAAASWSANTDTMFVTTGAGGVQLDLPAASAANVGKWLHAFKVDNGAGALTIKANNGSDTLNGTTNGTIQAPVQWRQIECVGYQSTGWICSGPI